MPRNSSGTYTLPAGNPVVANTLIETAWANPTMADLGAALTDSLDRYGRGGMLAQLKLADGLLAAPAFGFNSEASTGLYRPSAGAIAVSVLGVLAATFATAGITFAKPPIYAADPASGNELTRKSYVDTAITTAGGAFVKKIGDTMSGALAITTGNAALSIASGNAALNTYTTFGRAATEATVGISGGASQLVTGDAAGDFSIRNSAGRIILAPGGFTPVAWLTTTGLGINIVPTTPLHAALTESTAYSSANMLAASSTLLTLRNLSTTNGTYGAIRVEATGAGSNAVTAIAAVWVGDGASALTFGTRENAAGNVVEAMRISNTRNVGVGYQAPTYGAGLTCFGVNATTQPIIDLAIGGARQATFTVDSGICLLGTIANKPLHLYTNSSLKATLDTAGRLGIARTPTTHILEVNGSGAFGYTTDNAVRLIHNDAYISFYNTSVSTRSGYLQMLSTGTTVLANEVGGTAGIIALSVNGATRLFVDGNGRIYGSSLHNNAAGVTGMANQYIASGTFTPTQTGVTNVASAGSSSVQWMRVGNVVTVSGSVGVTPTGAGLTQIRSTLPIASAVNNPHEIAGGGCISATGPVVLINAADPSNDNVYFTFNAASGSAVTIYFTYTYVIL